MTRRPRRYLTFDHLARIIALAALTPMPVYVGPCPLITTTMPSPTDDDWGPVDGGYDWGTPGGGPGNGRAEACILT